MSRRLEQTFLQKGHTNTRKDAQHSSLSGKCKSEPQWDITSQVLKWLLSKRQQITSVDEDAEKREPFVRCWWEHKLVQPLWKTVWGVLRKLKIEPPYDPAILLLSIYLKKAKTLTRKNIVPSGFIAAWFAISQEMEVTPMSINREMDKDNVILAMRVKSCHFPQCGWT